MREIHFHSLFKRDYKRIQKRHYPLKELKAVIEPAPMPTCSICKSAKPAFTGWLFLSCFSSSKPSAPQQRKPFGNRAHTRQIRK